MYKTYVYKYLGCQARAPSSPVIIVGTHSDKMISVEQKVELNESLNQITKLYGDCDNQIEGTYVCIQVCMLLSLCVFMDVWYTETSIDL